jgi:hypothetical protein
MTLVEMNSYFVKLSVTACLARRVASLDKSLSLSAIITIGLPQYPHEHGGKNLRGRQEVEMLYGLVGLFVVLVVSWLVYMFRSPPGSRKV